MDTFTVRDLRERTGVLIHDAEQGKLALVTKHGHPVFLAVPFSEELVKLGLKLKLAINLYQESILTLGKAAKLAGQTIEEFMEKLGSLGIAVADYSAEELKEEIKGFV